MNFRPAHSGDAELMRAIAAQSGGAASWTADQYAELFAPAAPHRCILVMEDAGTVIGFIVGLIIDLVGGDEWEIENLAIRLEMQRRGLGSQLLAAFIAEARRLKATRIHLEVRASNQAALALYLKAGFQPIGRRAEYYAAPPEDAILLALQLS